MMRKKTIKQETHTWWQAWYGGPLLMALLFTTAALFYACGPGHSETEKKLMARYAHYLHPTDKDSTNIIYIDVAYDKQLVSPTNHPEAVGEVAITDRRKLACLLQELCSDTSYEVVMIDVSLNANTPTDADSALVSLLLNMPRTVIAAATEGDLIDPRLESMAGQTAYPISASEAGFVKYPLWRDGHTSMPMSLYMKTSGHAAVPLAGPFGRESNSLVCSHIFPTLDHRVGATDTLRLGADIVDGGFLQSMPHDYLKNMIVVVGAISEGDVHSSYAGDISGPEINLNTYLALKHGRHRIGWLQTLLLVACFYLICFSIVRSRWKVTDRLQRSPWWPARAFGLILSGLIYTILLNLIFLLNYILFAQVLSITPVAFGFLVFNKIVQTNKIARK